MKFLIDHQLPPVLVDFFRDRDCECHHVLELGMASSSDAEIYRYASETARILVSKDEDFFYLSRRPGSDARLLWVRLGNCRTVALLEALAQP